MLLDLHEYLGISQVHRRGWNQFLYLPVDQLKNGWGSIHFSGLELGRFGASDHCCSDPIPCHAFLGLLSAAATLENPVEGKNVYLRAILNLGIYLSHPKGQCTGS
jgi:hypothetical protein